jgi:fructose-bisphosphate aldolase class II
MAKAAKVPVAVHLDHGFDINEIKLAIELGFSSVMVDASKYSFEENVRITKSIVDYAEKYHVTVEAELGYLGGGEGEYGSETGYVLTSVKDATGFVKLSDCDALAVAIGNAHGLRKVQPKLDFERLEEINHHVSVPLVLHGGSGTTDEDFKRCINNGITKINLASIIHKNYLEAMALADEDYVKSIGRLEDAAYKTLSYYMNVFGSKDRAKNF